MQMVIGHWSLVIGKEVEVEKGRKGDRRQSERLKLSILNIITALRILHWISGLGFGICDFEFGIWDLGFGIWNLGFYSFTDSWRTWRFILLRPKQEK